MVTRVPAQHLFRHILCFAAGAALVLTLFSAGFSGASALAATPYEFTDGSEGDPGDGVLSPRAREGQDQSADDLDENLIPDDHGYLLVPLFTNWASPGTVSVRFLLIPRSEPGYGIVTGVAPWSFLFPGRGWNHAR
jgi:hypothetical protein